jgi:hypothetical protein
LSISAIRAGDAGPPLILRLEIDDGFEHLGRRRIGRRRGTAGLAVDGKNLREGFDDPVLGLQQVRRLGDRDPRQGRRHVEQRAFVEVRHELRAKPAGRPKRDTEDHEGKNDGQHLRLEDNGNDRAVQPDQESIERISGTIRPRTKITISAGTSVTDKSAAAAIENVLV